MMPKISLKLEMPVAARVRMGPAEMALTRTPFSPSSSGEVAHRGLQGGLGHAHDVVVGHGALGAQVGQGEDGAAVLHERQGGAGDGDQGVGADVQGHPEAFTAGLVKGLLQLLPARVGNGVHEEIEAAPFLLDLREDPFDLGVLGHVAAQDELGAEALRERPHPLLEDLVQVREGKGGPFLVQLLRDAPRDALVVGHAEDDALFPGHQTHSSAPPALSCVRTRYSGTEQE